MENAPHEAEPASRPDEAAAPPQPTSSEAAVCAAPEPRVDPRAMRVAEIAPNGVIRRYGAVAERAERRHEARERGDETQVLRLAPQAAFDDPAPAPMRPRRGVMFYVSRAAIVVAALAAGGALGAHPAPLRMLAGLAKPATPTEDQETTRLAADIRAMRASLVEMSQRDEARAARITEDAHGLRKLVDGLRTETMAGLAQTTTRLDHAEREAGAKFAPLAERLDRLDKTIAALMPTATLTPRPAVAPRKPTPIAAAEPPRLIPGWVVRDADRASALIEGRDGAMEVTVGETVPGAGKVRAIEQRGGGWIVLTSRGIIDAAR